MFYKGETLRILGSGFKYNKLQRLQSSGKIIPDFVLNKCI